MLIDKKVLYVAEVASLLGCCSQVVYQLIDSGKLKAYKEPGRKCWRITAEAVDEYIHQSQKEYGNTRIKL